MIGKVRRTWRVMTNNVSSGYKTVGGKINSIRDNNFEIRYKKGTSYLPYLCLAPLLILRSIINVKKPSPLIVISH